MDLMALGMKAWVLLTGGSGGTGDGTYPHLYGTLLLGGVGQPGYQAIHLSAENTISGLFRDSL